jgi:hypothetical protein
MGAVSIDPMSAIVGSCMESFSVTVELTVGIEVELVREAPTGRGRTRLLFPIGVGLDQARQTGSDVVPRISKPAIVGMAA